jgi:hypothetical protein
MPKEEQNRLMIKVRPYTLCDGHLHKLGLNGVLRQCLTPIEAFNVLEEFHEELAGGHYCNNTTLKKSCQQATGGQLFTKMLTCVKGAKFVND